MSWTHSKYKDTKKKAEKRLTNWVQRTRGGNGLFADMSISQSNEDEKKQLGITRLYEDFGTAFKKIEWNQNKEKGASTIEVEHFRESLTTPSKASNVSSLHFELDRNSSNVSRQDILPELSQLPYINSPERRKAINQENDAQMSIWLSSKKRRRCMKKKLTGLPDILDIVQPQIAEIYEANICSTSAPETWETDVTYTSSDKELVHLNNNKTTLRPKSGQPIPQVSKTSPIHLKSLNARVREKGRLPQDVQGMPGTERKKALRNKFKRLMRKWNCVRILLKLSKVSTQEKEMNQTFRVVDNMGSVFTFDPGYSKKVITTYGKLSDRVRIIFRKDPKERTKADERILLEVINRLPLFSNFPSRVKQDLAQVMVFDTFEKGRIVIRQGDPGTRVYFLLSGQVFLIQTETDSKTGAKRTFHLKTLSGGSIFGEMALIRSIRRDHTAVTSDDSEFLSLGKDDFEKVLKKRLLKDNTERYDFLRSSQHLKAFSDKQIQKCADSSELKTYSDNKVILGDVETTENVYFIKKGRCTIVKRVYFVRHQSPYIRPVLFLHETPEQREKFLNKTYGRKMRWRRQEVHLLTITTLYPGDYFGAGENLQDLYVVARGKIECLLLNAVQFQIHSKMDVLRRLKTEREDVLPSDIELYKRFETNRKWLEYRQQLVEEVSGRKRGRHESEIYVPLTDI